MPTHHYRLPYQYKPCAAKPQVKPLRKRLYTLYIMEKQSAGIFRPTAYGKTTRNHDIPIKQKGCEKFVRKSEKRC